MRLIKNINFLTAVFIGLVSAVRTMLDAVAVKLLRHTRRRQITAGEISNGTRLGDI